MPRGYDSSQHPARKVSKEALSQPQPYSGGAGGKEPPKKEVAIGGAPPPPPPPGGPNNPNKDLYGPPKKKRDDYNSKPSKPAPEKDKGYPSKVGPKKEDKNPHEYEPRKKDDYNKDSSKKQIKKPDTKGIPNDRKYPRNTDHDDRYKNGWYN